MNFQVNQRVRVLQSAGFSRGARGIVTEVEGNQIWVLRDGAGSPAYFLECELEHETEIHHRLAPRTEKQKLLDRINEANTVGELRDILREVVRKLY